VRAPLSTRPRTTPAKVYLAWPRISRLDEPDAYVHRALAVVVLRYWEDPASSRSQRGWAARPATSRARRAAACASYATTRRSPRPRAGEVNGASRGNRASEGNGRPWGRTVGPDDAGSEAAFEEEPERRLRRALYDAAADTIDPHAWPFREVLRRAERRQLHRIVRDLRSHHHPAHAAVPLHDLHDPVVRTPGGRHRHDRRELLAHFVR